MKRSSPLLAKLAIALSLIIGTTSGYYANKSRESMTVTKSSIAKLTSDDKQLKAAHATAETVLTQRAPTPKLDTTLSSLLVAVMKERLATGVNVSSLVPSKNVLAAEAASFEKMAESLDGSPLKSVRLNIRGTYQSYEGFLQYVSRLRELPVAVVFLKVEANSFELGVRAYGT